MGDIWATDKLALFIAFVLPGFISMQIYRLFVAGDDSDIAKKLPAIVAYSALHYFVWGWLIFVTNGMWRNVAIYLVVLGLPTLWPIIVLLLRDNEKWSKVFWPPKQMFAAMLKPEATPWDRVFSKQKFIRITLKDGGFVGGFLDKGSLISTSPGDEQIFIQSEYAVDQESGEIGEQLEATGVLINGTEIKLIELIEP